MSLLEKFINGLRKSFDGKQHLREINTCGVCGEPSFFKVCLQCEMDLTFKYSEKLRKSKYPKW